MAVPRKKASSVNGETRSGGLPKETAPLTKGSRLKAYKLNPEEFGPLENEEHLYTQQFTEPLLDRTEELVPYYVMIQTHFLYLVLLVLGHILDFLDSFFDKQYRQNLREHDGYAPLLTDFDSFYTRRFKARLEDVFARPTTGVPGRIISVFERKFVPGTYFKFESDFFDREPIKCVNLSSYNYLGFAQSEGQCSDEAEKVVGDLGIVAGGTRFAGGTSQLHLDTEELVADFVGKEASMIFSMGYGTNAMLFANLVDKRCLVLSDQLNHASIRTGIRLSGAVIKVFKHNDMDELERIVREQIAQGQPRTRRPWHKILVVFEGLYSMEGTMCNLPKLVELRKKYGIYLFMDEAHSIGAMGPNGRGICDYYNVPPSDVDILMGTFTKSFGSVGGYVAADRSVIDRLRISNMSTVYGEAPAPPTLAQIQASLRTLTGEVRPGEGELRLRRLAFNSRYLRVGLRRMGFVVSGHIDSPVIPVFLFHPTKLALTSRLALLQKIAIVVVGYPATDLATGRIRLCMSSALTKADLDYVLEKLEVIGDELRLKVAKGLDGKPAPRERFATFRDSLAKQVLDPTLS